MAMQFKKAVKSESRLRMALVGPSGAGKTFTALRFAAALSKRRIAVIDTERGSASKYADRFDFDCLDLETHHPDRFCDAINAAVGGGEFDLLVIDSLSHAWMGRGGALEQVDNEAAKIKGNSFGAWKNVTPMHNRLVDTIVSAPLHVIATMRSKSEWLQDVDERGKKVIRKVGTQAVQRDGMEFEFDVVADMEPARNTFVVTKTRCPDLTGYHADKPGDEVADILSRWLAGEKSAFTRAVDAIFNARTIEELKAVGEMVEALDKQEVGRVRAIYATRRDILEARSNNQSEES